jgi:hypothetical protein
VNLSVISTGSTGSEPVQNRCGSGGSGLPLKGDLEPNHPPGSRRDLRAERPYRAERPRLLRLRLRALGGMLRAVRDAPQARPARHRPGQAGAAEALAVGTALRGVHADARGRDGRGGRRGLRSPGSARVQGSAALGRARLSAAGEHAAGGQCPAGGGCWRAWKRRLRTKRQQSRRIGSARANPATRAGCRSGFARCAN